MKRIFLSLSLVMTLFVSSAFAKDIVVAYPVLRSFEKAFPLATNVKWDQTTDFTIASFTANQKQMFAYFNDEGFLIVLAESISAKELPSSLQAQLEAKYAACKVNGLYKMDADGDVSYFAEVSNARQKYLLTSVGKKWSVVAIK